MGVHGAMEKLSLTSKSASRADVSDAFVSLDQGLQQELTEEEKGVMNYNVIMLEHALCKIKRLTACGVSMKDILQEI